MLDLMLFSSVHPVRYSPRFDPCPQCGAWKWAQNHQLMQRDQFLCGECNHLSKGRDIWVVLVGQD